MWEYKVHFTLLLRPPTSHTGEVKMRLLLRRMAGGPVYQVGGRRSRPISWYVGNNTHTYNTFFYYLPELDSISVSVFVLIFIELDKTETDPNNNLMMRRAGLSTVLN